MTTKKRHHYIPETYLKNFLIADANPCVWVYEKGDKLPYATSSDNIGVEKHFYAYNSKDGSFNTNSYEDIFNDVEGGWTPIINKIEQGNQLSNEDLEKMLIFVALMREFQIFGLDIKHFRKG